MKRVPERFSRYQTADYLASRPHMAAYLEAVTEEGGDDPACLAAALGTIARMYGMVRLARDTGLTREGLYKALSADGNPSLGTVLKVMKALGLELTLRPAQHAGQRR
ncbi:MAG TPA: addiction module antidote protein [Steroidobacteraceae bacterium]|nr:addiction module antidote protein [Steroidobacteraceae bacterium]